MSDKSMSILEHLDELRRVIIISLLSVIPGAVLGWYVRDYVLAALIVPVKRMDYNLVFISATEALTTEIKIAVVAGLIFASPVISYQVWKFILPALHTHEKRYIMILVPVSLLLFAGGIAFAYYSVFIYAVQFLLSFGGEGLTPMLSLSKYLSFAIWFLLPFGLMFELPLLIVALARLGIVTPRFLAAKRKWAVLAVFLIAAIVTPTTDMFTQGVMGLAMYLLYEISIWLAYLVRPRRKRQAEEVSPEGGDRDPGGDTGEGQGTGEGAGVDEAAEEAGEALEETEASEETESVKVADTVEETENKAGRDLERIYRNIVERGNKDEEKEKEKE